MNYTCVKSGIYFKFYRCYGNKNGLQNRLKRENCNFGPNLRLRENDFLRIIDQHSYIPNKPLNMLCVVIILIVC